MLLVRYTDDAFACLNLVDRTHVRNRGLKIQRRLKAPIVAGKRSNTKQLKQELEESS